MTQDPVTLAWSSQFGDRYTERNAADETRLRRRTRAWARWLDAFGSREPRTILEVGCNVGINQRALQRLTGAELWGVEPNDSARAKLVADGILPAERVIAGRGEALPFADASMDLVFTHGVLIHVHPDTLGQVADEMVRVSRRFILISEYFAADPEEKPYRGETGLLFKRDFGGYFLDRFPGLEVVADGFLWKRTVGIDDATWTLLEKRS